MEKYIFMFLVGVLVGPSLIDRLSIDPNTDLTSSEIKNTLHPKKSEPPKHSFYSESISAEKTSSLSSEYQPKAKNKLSRAVDPLHSFNFADLLDEAFAEPERNELTIKSLMALWCRREPAAAFQWSFLHMFHNADESFDEEYIHFALSEYAKQDPDLAGEAIRLLPVGDIRTRLVKHFVIELEGLRSPGWIKEWVDGIENYEERQNGLKAVAQSYAHHDPHDFFDFIEEERYQLSFEEDESYFQSIVKKAANSIGEDILCNCGVDEIITGVNNLSTYPVEAQPAIAEGMLKQFMSNRPDAIEQLTEYLPRGDIRDESIHQFVVNDTISSIEEFKRFTDLTDAIDDGYLKSITAAAVFWRWQEDRESTWFQRDDELYWEESVIEGRLQEIILSSMPK